MTKKDESLESKSEQVETKNPPSQEDEEIPQDAWDKFDDAMDQILKVPKNPPNQQAG